MTDNCCVILVWVRIYLSRDMTKPTKWVCAQRRLRSTWALNGKLSSCGQGRLWSDWVDAQADLSLRWAHSHFVGFVMSRLISLHLYGIAWLHNWIWTVFWWNPKMTITHQDLWPGEIYLSDLYIAGVWYSVTCSKIRLSVFLWYRTLLTWLHNCVIQGVS